MASKQWSFYNPVRIQFGREKRRILAGELKDLRVLAVSTGRGRRQFTGDHILGPLARRLTWVDTVTPNPGIDDVEKRLERFQAEAFDVVLAFGGGSAIDFGKAASALLAPASDPQGLRSLIAEPERLMSDPPLPLFAVPTTSGTGSEVTPFATIWDHQDKKKLSLASASLFPRLAIVDPALTDDLPAEATFSSGLDALNQAFESVWNKNSTPVTVALASKAISLTLAGLPALLKDLGDQQARDRMAEASLLAGLCISQTKTALCHAMSYPLTARLGIPHGWACAFTMGEVFKICDANIPEIFNPIISATGHDTAQGLLAEVLKLLDALKVKQRVKELAEESEEMQNLVPEMTATSRTDNFILPVNSPIIAKIIEASGG